MAPPITPSPHRFVITNSRSSAGTRQTKSSNTPFNATPRFSVPSTPQSILKNELREVTSFAQRYKNLTHGASREREVNQIEPGDLPHQNDGNADRDNSSSRRVSIDESDESQIREEPTPKKRKQSPTPELFNQEFKVANHDNLLTNATDDLLPFSPCEPLSSPPIHKKIASARAPRFLIAAHNPSSSPRTPNTIKRPIFKPPDPEEDQTLHQNPLPDEFSPHKNGQGYVQGGLAAVLRDWLINIGSSTFTIARRTEVKDPWVMRILIYKFSGDVSSGMTLVKGKLLLQSEDDENQACPDVNIVLAGDGASIGLQKSPTVEEGKIVGINGPFWNILINDEKWCVGVDWRVLE